MQKRNALIAGATGLVGNSLLNQLLKDDGYDKIIVITRKPIKLQHPKLIQQQIDFDRIETMNPGFQVI